MKVARFFYLFIFGLLLIGCSSSKPTNLEPSLDNVYISSGVEQYFLTNLPFWANFSTAGKCLRKKPIRYLNFQNLRKSYDLKYNQLIHMQHMLNNKLYAYKSSTGQNNLSPKDESYVFHNVYQQVIAESFDFIIPKYKRVSVVWIDPFLKDMNKIKRIFKRNDVLNGHPILLSHCLNSFQLEALAQKLKIDELGVKYLSAEMLNIFSQEGTKNTFFSFDISSIIPGKDITVFSTIDSNEITGDYNFKSIK